MCLFCDKGYILLDNVTICWVLVFILTKAKGVNNQIHQKGESISLRKSWIARLNLGREENYVRFVLNRVLKILFGNCVIWRSKDTKFKAKIETNLNRKNLSKIWKIILRFLYISMNLLYFLYVNKWTLDYLFMWNWTV